MSQLPIDDMDEEITILYSSLPGDSLGAAALPSSPDAYMQEINTDMDDDITIVSSSFPSDSNGNNLRKRTITQEEGKNSTNSSALPGPTYSDKKVISLDTDLHDYLDEELVFVNSRMTSVLLEWSNLESEVDVDISHWFGHRDKPVLWRRLGIDRELPPGYLEKMDKAATSLDNGSKLLQKLNLSRIEIADRLDLLSAKHKDCFDLPIKGECNRGDFTTLKAIRTEVSTLAVQQEKFSTALELFNSDFDYLYELDPVDHSIDLKEMNAAEFKLKDDILAVSHIEQVLNDFNFVVLRTENVQTLQKVLCSSMITYRKRLDANRSDLCTCKKLKLNLTTEVYLEKVDNIASIIADVRVNLRKTYNLITKLKTNLKICAENDGVSDVGAEKKVNKLRHDVCDIEAKHRRLVQAEEKIKASMEELFPEWSKKDD